MELEKELLLSIFLANNEGRYKYRVVATVEGQEAEQGRRDNPKDALALAAQVLAQGAHQVSILHL